MINACCPSSSFSETYGFSGSDDTLPEPEHSRHAFSFPLIYPFSQAEHGGNVGNWRDTGDSASGDRLFLWISGLCGTSSPFRTCGTLDCFLGCSFPCVGFRFELPLPGDPIERMSGSGRGDRLAFPEGSSLLAVLLIPVCHWPESSRSPSGTDWLATRCRSRLGLGGLPELLDDP